MRAYRLTIQLNSMASHLGPEIITVDSVAEDLEAAIEKAKQAKTVIGWERADGIKNAVILNSVLVSEDVVI